MVAKYLPLSIIYSFQFKTSQTNKINQENLGVKEFRYLGSKIPWDGRNENEIKSRIAQAKMGFNSKQKLLCSSSISLENRKMLLKTYV